MVLKLGSVREYLFVSGVSRYKPQWLGQFGWRRCWFRGRKKAKEVKKQKGAGKTLVASFLRPESED
jgi:hypothetical protein